MKLEGDRGVVVTRVVEDSFAFEIGLREKDVILSINRTAVKSVDDIRKVQSTLKPGSAVVFRVARPNPFAARGENQPASSSFLLSGTLPRE
jgi:S1-C subfamily serine protease